jgi:hypothetical protein
MNTRIVKIIISLSLFVVFTGIAVNAQNIRVIANIPFDFVVGDVTMPAGDYDVTKLSTDSGLFRVRDPEGKYVAARLVMRVERRKAPAQTMLIFNRYRENGGEVSHFLSQVWVEGSATGYEFFKFRVEREAALRAAKRDIITIVVPRANGRAE